MYQQQGSNKSTNVTNIHEKLTRQGRIRAMYTLKCKFTDGNRFTYRSDVNLANYIENKYTGLSELDAIILKFTSLQQKLQECKLFDNRLPYGEDLILHYSGTLNKVLVNQLPQPYNL